MPHFGERRFVVSRLGDGDPSLGAPIAWRLAEAGATAHEIMSITGHKTLSEVQRYTAAAEREHLAEQAMAKLSKRMRTKQHANLSNMPIRLDKSASK